MQSIKYHQALAIARIAHHEQKRFGNNEDYIVHPIAVAEILAKYNCSEDEIIAGLLHDTIEDTEDYEMKQNISNLISLIFGIRVLHLILGATKISKKSDGNRAKRVEIDNTHYAESIESHNIKLADLIHNLSDIETLDQSFAKKYIIEKNQLLTRIEIVGKANAILLLDARSLVNRLIMDKYS